MATIYKNPQGIDVYDQNGQTFDVKTGSVQPSQEPVQAISSQNTPITGTDFTPVPAPVVTPYTPPPVPSIQSIQVTEPTPTPEAKGNDLIKQLENLQTNMLGQTTEKAVAVQGAVQPYEEQLRDINKQIRQQQLQAMKDQEEALGRGETLGFATGEAARVNRQNAFEAFRLSSLSEALQGNILSATKMVELSIATKFAQKEKELAAARQNIINNYDSFTAAQKKRADITLATINKEDAFVQRQKEDQKAAQIETLKYVGIADTQTLDEMSKADSALGVARIAQTHNLKTLSEQKAEKELATFGDSPDIKEFKSFFPNVDVSTPAGQQQFLDWKARVGEAGRKGETTLTPENRRVLVGSNLSDEMISNIEEGVRTIGIEKVLEDDYTDEQKTVIRKVYGKEVKEITNAQLLQAAQTMKQADIENFFTARYTEEEINNFAKKAGFARFFKKRATEKTNFLASPKAREKIAELLKEQYIQQGYTVK